MSGHVNLAWPAKPGVLRTPTWDIMSPVALNGGLRQYLQPHDGAVK